MNKAPIARPVGDNYLFFFFFFFFFSTETVGASTTDGLIGSGLHTGTAGVC